MGWVEYEFYNFFRLTRLRQIYNSPEGGRVGVSPLKLYIAIYQERDEQVIVNKNKSANKRNK